MFFGFVRIRRHALAAVGCLILLSTWPASLYRITDSVLGAALGLVGAGAVLITTVVLMSHRRRTAVISDKSSYLALEISNAKY